MSAWSELEQTGLLGTRRADLRLPPISPPLDTLLASLRSDDKAHDLLRAAGTLDLYEQIGRAPGRLQPEFSPPLPPETRPACPPDIGHYLAQLLDNRLRDLLPE
ncbi:MAG: hypothetical protein ACK2UK_05255, partial [Candidatus Promineifilaceae bacterium]